MFGALGRFWRALVALFAGQVDSQTDEMLTNPHVVRAKYDEQIQHKRTRIQQLKVAISGLMHREESDMIKLRALSTEISEMDLDLEGSKAGARKRADLLQSQGKTRDEILEDVEFREAQEFHADVSSTLQEKEERIREIEMRLVEIRQAIVDHKLQMKEMARDLEKIRVEQSDAIADVISAKEIEAVNDMIAGISEDGSAAELQALREARGKLRARARISKEMAGTDAMAQRAKFRAAARERTSRDEFAQLIGVAQEVEGKGKAISSAVREEEKLS